MRFSVECLSILTLLIGSDDGSSCQAFTRPPTYSMTASTAIRSQPQKRHQKQNPLQYVRNEDEMGWMVQQQQPSQQQQQVYYQPSPNPNSLQSQQHQRHTRYEHGSNDIIDEQNDHYYDGQESTLANIHSSHSHHLPPLDYEARVEQRFSRYRRRRRLRHAAAVASPTAYGMELDRMHRQLRDINHGVYSSAAPPLVSTPIPIVQFRTNSDFPASDLPASQWMHRALPPLQFEDAEYSSCTVQKSTKVLVECDDDYFGGTVQLGGINYRLVDAHEGVVVPHVNSKEGGRSKRAYWLQDKLHDAIYGQVRYGTVLQKLEKPLQIMTPSSDDNIGSSNNERNRGRNGDEEWTSVIKVEWMATPESVAIKQMSWEKVREQREKLAEDPIKEVAAMQYLERWVEGRNHQKKKMAGRGEVLWGDPLSPTTTPQFIDSQLIDIEEEEETHIMMPLDLLSDNEHLYSITPYCAGGRLLDQIEHKSRFSEPEARYWMKQILKGLSYLKDAGVAHRDMSPENLMVHDGNVYIIDMGMCLRIPSSNHNHPNDHREHPPHPKERSLILPQTPCGKWYYLSPEVCLSEAPFDGPAVDLWAAGVILFIMLTGLPPWEEPKMTDENFKLMTTGHLVRILTERRAGLSVDAMDLLQRMFWLDPADRLSLEQVWKHPWMTHLEYNLSLDDE